MAEIDLTEQERAALQHLIDLARHVDHALDDSEEVQEDGLRSHIIQAQDFDDVVEAIDALNDLPDDKPGVTMNPSAKAEWALRRILVRHIATAPADPMYWPLAPSHFVNAAGINAFDMPGTVVRKLDGAFHAAATLPRITKTLKPALQPEPTAIDPATMELAENVGLIGPASRTHDLHAAIQRFHDLICTNATIKAAAMAAESVNGASPEQGAHIRPKGGSAAPKLRAMATNYPAGHLWDKLDAQACIRGALEIEALRSQVPQPSPAAQRDFVDVDTSEAVKQCLEIGETLRSVRRLINLLLDARSSLSLGDLELRERIEDAMAAHKGGA